MGKITYQNKVTLNENPNVADVNKVKADDLNEIKNVVNANYDEINDKLLNIVKTEATPNSSYISTVQLNYVVKCDKIVTVDFRGLVSANIPNNTTIITLPYHFANAGTAPAYLGGAYDYASTLWCSWGNYGDAFRAGSGFGSASGKYVHIHLVYITSD